MRPKFQPQRGVTGWRPTGARQPTALSPFPSCFGSPGRRDHDESLTCRETSTHRPGGPASPASLCPASASKLGPQVAPLQPRTPDHAQPPRSRSRISLTGHGTAGRFLLMAAGSPQAPWTTPAHGPHQRPPTLSLSPPALPVSLAGRHVGVREGKGFVEADGSRSGRNPKCSEQGGSVSRPGGGGGRDGAARASAGLAGPWSTLARRTPPSSPHSLSAPRSLSRGRRASTLEGKLQTPLSNRCLAQTGCLPVLLSSPKASVYINWLPK